MTFLQRLPVLAALVGALALCLHPSAQAQINRTGGASAQIDSMAQAFDAALQAYERSHWLPAFEQLVRLAEQGHVQAARLAMQMRQYGPALYGQTFSLSPDQVERFTRVRSQTQALHATGTR